MIDVWKIFRAYLNVRSVFCDRSVGGRHPCNKKIKCYSHYILNNVINWTLDLNDEVCGLSNDNFTSFLNFFFLYPYKLTVLILVGKEIRYFYEQHKYNS